MASAGKVTGLALHLEEGLAEAAELRGRMNVFLDAAIGARIIKDLGTNEEARWAEDACRWLADWHEGLADWYDDLSGTVADLLIAAGAGSPSAIAGEDVSLPEVGSGSGWTRSRSLLYMLGGIHRLMAVENAIGDLAAKLDGLSESGDLYVFAKLDLLSRIRLLLAEAGRLHASLAQLVRAGLGEGIETDL